MELDEDLALPVDPGVDVLTHRISLARLQHISNLAWCLGSWLPHLVSLAVLLIRLVRSCFGFVLSSERFLGQYHVTACAHNHLYLKLIYIGTSLLCFITPRNTYPSTGAQPKWKRHGGDWGAVLATSAYSQAMWTRGIWRGCFRLR